MSVVVKVVKGYGRNAKVTRHGGLISVGGRPGYVLWDPEDKIRRAHITETEGSENAFQIRRLMRSRIEACPCIDCTTVRKAEERNET